jgi:hypothetical protein
LEVLSQPNLCRALQNKLGYSPRRSGTSVKRLDGKNVVQRGHKKGSVQLDPPQGYLKVTSRPSFDLSSPTSHPEQIAKVRKETGFSNEELRALVRCPLRADLARTLYTLHVIADVLTLAGAGQILEQYIRDAMAAIQRLAHETPAATARPFFMARSRELSALKTADGADSPASRAIRSFLEYLRERWNVS